MAVKQRIYKYFNCECTLIVWTICLEFLIVYTKDGPVHHNDFRVSQTFLNVHVIAWVGDGVGRDEGREDVRKGGVELRRQPSDRHAARRLSCLRITFVFFYIIWFDLWPYHTNAVSSCHYVRPVNIILYTCNILKDSKDEVW